MRFAQSGSIPSRRAARLDCPTLANSGRSSFSAPGRLLARRQDDGRDQAQRAVQVGGSHAQGRISATEGTAQTTSETETILACVVGLDLKLQ